MTDFLEGKGGRELLLLLLLYDMNVSCHRPFFPVLLLNQRWSPPLRLQASRCSTFRIMCDVPSIAVFCSESIECFPGTLLLLSSSSSLLLFCWLYDTYLCCYTCIVTNTLLMFRCQIPRCAQINRHIYYCYALHNTNFQGNLASAYLRVIIRPAYRNTLNKLYTLS